MKRFAAERSALQRQAIAWLAALLLPVLAACAAPAPEAVEAAAGTDAAAQAETRPGVGQKIDLPPMSEPYPPARIDEPGTPGRIDRSCRVDADCVVRVEGPYQACVNRDSPVDRAGMRALCEEARGGAACATGADGSGFTAVGASDISGCRCVRGQCIAAVEAIEPSQDPPVPVR